MEAGGRAGGRELSLLCPFESFAVFRCLSFFLSLRVFRCLSFFRSSFSRGIGRAGAGGVAASRWWTDRGRSGR